MHDGNQAPKAASNREGAAGHGGTGVRLADGAAEGILAIGAGAAAAGDFIPVDRVLSVGRQGRSQAQAEHADQKPCPGKAGSGIQENSDF